MRIGNEFLRCLSLTVKPPDVEIMLGCSIYSDRLSLDITYGTHCRELVYVKLRDDLNRCASRSVKPSYVETMVLERKIIGYFFSFTQSCGSGLKLIGIGSEPRD